MFIRPHQDKFEVTCPNINFFNSMYRNDLQEGNIKLLLVK